MKLYSVVAGASLALGAIALPTIGQAKVIELEITTAPPPPFMVEVTPPQPREGFIYEPGHYSWDGSRYVWIDAQYVRQREGHIYTPSVVEQRGGKWIYAPGHWEDD